MAHHKRLIVLMAIAVIIAGYVLLPRSDEHVAMLARDGLYESAAKELSALRVAGDRQPYSLMQTYLLREKQGDRAGALDALEAYLSIRPDDPAARENEAEMLLQNGLLDRYLDSFARLVAARPLSDRIKKQLIGLYRLHGRIDDELATLRAYAGTSMLGLAEIQRLGAILAERGDWLEAERWLDRADRLAPPDASAVRLLLLDVLIENNRIGEAFQRASAWIAEWHSAYLAGKLILRMARARIRGTSLRSNPALHR